jgi:hypothetical protein
MARKREHRSADRDISIMNEILGELQSHEQDALARYYVERQSEDEVVVATGLDREYFRELRAIVRGKFFKQTGRGN